MSVKIAEVQSIVFADVKKTEPVWLYLNRTQDSLRYLGLRGAVLDFTEFKPLQDLKKGDQLKITFEKI